MPTVTAFLPFTAVAVRNIRNAEATLRGFAARCQDSPPIGMSFPTAKRIVL